jgi:hypothetical protein
MYIMLGIIGDRTGVSVRLTTYNFTPPFMGHAVHTAASTDSFISRNSQSSSAEPHCCISLLIVGTPSQSFDNQFSVIVFPSDIQISRSRHISAPYHQYKLLFPPDESFETASLYDDPESDEPSYGFVPLFLDLHSPIRSTPLSSFLTDFEPCTETAPVRIGISNVPDSGFGLFTTQRITKGTIICSYKGVIEHLSEGQTPTPMSDRDFYYPPLDVVVRGSPTSYGVYANDPNNDQLVNAKIVCDQSDGDLLSFDIVSQVDCDTDEEVFISYGDVFWQHSGIIPNRIDTPPPDSPGSPITLRSGRVSARPTASSSSSSSEIVSLVKIPEQIRKIPEIPESPERSDISLSDSSEDVSPK